MVNRAKRDHISTAENPTSVARPLVTIRPLAPALLAYPRAPARKRAAPKAGPAKFVMPRRSSPTRRPSRPTRLSPGQTKNCPPFALIVDPVINPASSLARNTTIRAISSGSPKRPTGICGMMRSFSTFSSIALTISVPI